MNIIYDDTHLTQPYVLMVDGEEVFRANTYAKCERHLAWKDYQIDSSGERLGWRRMSIALGAVILATSTVLILSSSAFGKCPKGVDCRDWCRIGEVPPKCRDGSGSGSFAARRQKEEDEAHRGRGLREFQSNKSNKIQTAPSRPIPRLPQPQPKPQPRPQICTKNQARACVVPKAIYNHQPPDHGQPDTTHPAKVRGAGTR